MTYIPRRLIDINFLKGMLHSNSQLTYTPTLLIDSTSGFSDTIKINKKIQQIKSGGYKKIYPNLLNGLLMITIILIIYSVLHYKYYKKKGLLKN